MKEEKLKEAFSRIKEDILNLGKEISTVREEFLDTNQLIKQLNEEIIELKIEKIAENSEKTSLETLKQTSTLRQIIPTHLANPTDNPTHPQEIGGLKYSNIGISIGNEGVPTDRQTDRQTDTPTHFIPENIQYPENKTVELDIQKAADILDSLNTLKKQIRHKFKHLTNQEMLVFSTIYQLEEQNPESVTYKEIALKLHLSESSIRDYVQRIINKGIPIKKYKINNKKLILSISQDLKRVATLSTIIKLREL
jgi:hypothetical protein